MGDSFRDNWLDLAITGDQSAQAALLERYRGQLRRMIAVRLDRRVAARVDPSDVVQETINDAYQRMPEYLLNPQIPFFPWLRRIAADRLADVYRTHLAAEKRSVLREHPWTHSLNDESVAELAQTIVVSSIDPGDKAMRAELIAKANAALSQLRPLDREILVMRYLEQLGVPEIAEVLGISHTAVTSRHLRALQRLRRALENGTGDSSSE